MSTDQAAIDQLARGALAPYGLDPGSRVELINVSENWTYRVDTPDGARYALRVHRPGYHTADEIESELRWIDALRYDGAVETDGQHVDLHDRIQEADETNNATGDQDDFC